MKITRLLLSLLLSFAISFSAVHADDQKIKDLDQSSSFAREAIMKLADQNIVSGNQNGSFDPKKPITRLELVVLLVKVLGLDTSTPEQYPVTFKDVPRNHWAFAYVHAAYREGIITGVSKNEFGINKTCTREQIAVMFIRALNLIDESVVFKQKRINSLSDNNAVSEWAKKEVDVALTSGLMTGIGQSTFAPKSNATKEQSAVVLNRFMEDRANIISKVNNEYGFNKEMQLILNGDQVPAELYMVDENNNVFVSDKFLAKYYLKNFNLGGTYVKDFIFYYNTENVSSADFMRNFWIKAGSKNAYRDYELIYYNKPVTPYEDEAKFADRLIKLEYTPFVQAGNIYISAKDFAKIAGFKYKADPAINKVLMEYEYVNKFPGLHSALSLGAYGQYRGEIISKKSVSMIEPATSSYVKIDSDMQARIHDTGTYAYYHFLVDSKKEGKDEFAVNEIKHGGFIYFLDNDQKWFKYDYRDFDIPLGEAALDPYSVQPDDRGNVVDDRIIIAYGISNISKIGKVNIDGIAADKYVVKYDEEAMKVLYTEAVYDIMKKAYNGTMVQEMEFYVVDEQLIKQINRFSGQTIDSKTKNKVDVKIETVTDYINIGVEYKIEPPKETDIKIAEE